MPSGVELGNARFAADVDRLVAAIDLPAAAPAWRRRLVWLGLAAGVALAGGMAGWPLSRASARPAINGDWQAQVDYGEPMA